VSLVRETCTCGASFSGGSVLVSEFRAAHSACRTQPDCKAERDAVLEAIKAHRSEMRDVPYPDFTELAEINERLYGALPGSDQ
jgi:hypothetical protein